MIITIFSLIVLLFSIIIHEIAHGSVAYYLGDPTAKYAGRLSLNPLKHLDPVGSVVLPLFLLFFTEGKGPIFGWAKPVPINPYNFRDQKWGKLKVAIAGPATNFVIALSFGLPIRFLPLPFSMLKFFSIIVIYNFLWGLFNLVPIPPLDGAHLLFSFLPKRLAEIKIIFQQYSFLLFILFILFGLDWLFYIAKLFYYLTVGYPFVL
ncbi:hypothetical protein AMJ50_01820 [Parcubacteria bacterium DG_74_3]|nr:MAG: hypothetical protein AMJ50_01820 [Parcubacteria bacterium DG_74_3]